MDAHNWPPRLVLSIDESYTEGGVIKLLGEELLDVELLSPPDGSS